MGFAKNPECADTGPASVSSAYISDRDVSGNHFASHSLNFVVFIDDIHHAMNNSASLCMWRSRESCRDRSFNSAERFMYLTSSWNDRRHMLCVPTHTPVSLLPPLLMSPIKDLYPCVSLRSFPWSQFLHPWNWRLEWILSPLISFIPILSASLYCSALTFSLGGNHEIVLSFIQRN